jgi:hypothetical protein
MPNKGTIYVAKSSFSIEIDGATMPIQAGVTRVREGHWLLRHHPDYFEPLTVHYELEDATAAPGKKRGGK